MKTSINNLFHFVEIGSCASVNILLPGQAHITWYLLMCMTGGGHLGYQFSESRFRAVLGVVLMHKGRLIFLRQDGHSASRELIIGQHTAQGLHHGCRGAQTAKSSPYCAYSPHLRSLCCAVHSGPPVQLFLYKKLQNSILQREKNRDKQWAGEEDKKH